MTIEEAWEALHTEQECEVLTEDGWCATHVKSVIMPNPQTTRKPVVEVMDPGGPVVVPIAFKVDAPIASDALLRLLATPREARTFWPTIRIVGAEEIATRLRRIAEGTIAAPLILLEERVRDE